jgi:hypothetical protein
MAFSACLAAVAGLYLAAAADGRARAELESVRNIVVARLKIVADARGLVLPMCDNDLCSLAVHVEVKSGDRWAPAPLSYAAGIPGGIPLERATFLRVEPNESKQFEVTFIRRDYVVKRNQQVRLRVDTWLSEESFRAHEPARPLSTAPFTIEEP